MFGRRRAPAAAATGPQQWAVVTRAPAPALPPTPGGRYGPTGWLPMPTQGPAPLQIGVYGDRLFNQFPARIDGVQLFQGVEGLNSTWQTPSTSARPNFQQTTYPENVPGGQRFGQTYTGGLGPISSRQMQARVVAAQVRQSGLQAMQWAQSLNGQST
jgi:hypothetical protein